MKKLEDYVPIDAKDLRWEWENIMNVPNTQWQTLEIERKLKIINDPGFPATLRTIQLNMLPVLVFEILDKNKPGK